MVMYKVLRQSKVLRKIDAKLSSGYFKSVWRCFRNLFVPNTNLLLWKVHDWAIDNSDYVFSNNLREFIFCGDEIYVKGIDGISYFYDQKHPSGGLNFSIINTPMVGVEIQIILSNLNSDAIFFDIGSGLGEYALNVAATFPQSHTFAFEPSRSTFEILSKNVSRNNLWKTITPLAIALSDEVGHAGLMSESDGKFLAKDQKILKQIKPAELVAVTTIDQFVYDQKLSMVDFIKADVEGLELFILRGAKDCLNKFHPFLLLEIQDWVCERSGYKHNEIFDFLRPYGYECVCSVSLSGELNMHSSINSADDVLTKGFNVFFAHNSRKFKIPIL